MKMLAEDETALKRVNIRDLAMSYGIYAEKFFMATEGNKVVVEHRTGAPSLEDAVKAIEEAKKRAKAASIEVDVTPAKDVSHEENKEEAKAEEGRDVQQEAGGGDADGRP
jgi:dihydroxyacetone kinase-like predicted kinase